MTRPAVLAVAFAVLALGAARGAAAQSFSMPKVALEFDPECNFSALRTYAWGTVDFPARDPSYDVNIRWHVERGLEQKGLRRAPEGTRPDVEVRYAVRSERKLRGSPRTEGTAWTGSPSDQRTTVNFDRVDEGAFSLEMVLPGSGKTVWQAETDFRIADRQKVEDATRRAVALLLAKYPPSKASPKP